jgi:dTDP-4-dehydrorhamnose reductase
MRKRVVILGSTGMLGHMVLKFLSVRRDFQVWGTHIADAADSLYFNVEAGVEGLERIFDVAGPLDYVINCIGVLRGAIDEADAASVQRAVRINADFPHELAALAINRHFRVIQISTDGVFSGAREYYEEDTPHDCPDIYGKTKSRGEVNGCSLFLNIRCSIIGPSPIEKMGLLEWLLGQPDGAQVSGFTNQIWNGVSTLQFARLCLKIIALDHFDTLRGESAVFHFAPNDPLSKYQLLCFIRDAFHRTIRIVPAVSGPDELRWILKTKYRGLKDIFPHRIAPKEMVEELYAFTNK